MKQIILLVLSLNTLVAQAQSRKCDSCNVFFTGDDYAGVLKCLSEVFKDPGDSDLCLLYSRAYANYKLADYTKAEKDIAGIIATKDKPGANKYLISNTYFLLARIYSKKNMVEKELGYLKLAQKYYASPELLLTLGYAYIKIKEYNKAITYCNMGIKLKPDSDKAYNNRALAYIKLKNIGNAQSDIDTALLLNPKNPYIYKHRGLLFLLKNNKQSACEDFEKAKALGYKEYGNEADKNEVDELIKLNCK